MWYRDRNESLTGDTTSFTARVTRMGCNGGTTGDALPPQVEYGDKEIVVVFQVTPRQTGDATCQSNNFVPYVVRFAEPIGARALIDGECRGSDGAPTTAFCDPNEIATSRRASLADSAARLHDTTSAP